MEKINLGILTIKTTITSLVAIDGLIITHLLGRKLGLMTHLKYHQNGTVYILNTGINQLFFNQFCTNASNLLK